ncbi:MAG: hypothetical protein KY454_11100 [Actinobacteria bacterium]|nr:hypothetical protein [Actinomycetota bacterium]MBW3651580.1 hypothetical protein [Actinomycetota bacterium]
MSGDPRPDPTPAPGPSPADRWWRIVGIVLGAVFVLGGLAVVAFIVMFVIFINSYGSNK